MIRDEFTFPVSKSEWLLKKMAASRPDVVEVKPHLLRRTRQPTIEILGYCPVSTKLHFQAKTNFYAVFDMILGFISLVQSSAMVQPIDNIIVSCWASHFSDSLYSQRVTDESNINPRLLAQFLLYEAHNHQA